MDKLFVNGGDPDRTPHSDLSMHCLPVTHLRYSRLKLANTVEPIEDYK